MCSVYAFMYMRNLDFCTFILRTIHVYGQCVIALYDVAKTFVREISIHAYTPKESR